MFSNSEDTIRPCFKSGDLVYSISQRNRGPTIPTWLSVICPDFGSSGNYTEVKEGRTRLYHVQRLGCIDELEQAWIPQSELKKIDPENVWGTVPKLFKEERYEPDLDALDDCRMLAKNANHERIEICKTRFEIFGLKRLKTENIDLKSQLKSMKESLDELKTLVISQNQDKLQNEQKSVEENKHLKNEFKSLKDSFEELKNSVTSQNQDQPKNEQEIESNNEIEQLKNKFKSLKDSFKELKNSVTSQNQDEPQNEQETKSNNESAKEIKLEKVEGHVEEVPKLNQIIKDLKIDNLKLSKENEGYVKVQKQNEALIKSLKEDLLKLSQENAHLKYGQGSKND